MGGWLAAEALRGVAMREKSIPTKVKNVILASPDIDIDVVPSPVRRDGIKAAAFHDPDIDARQGHGSVSSWLSGGVDRVGGSDLRLRMRRMLEELGVSVIDTSGVATRDAARAQRLRRQS